MMMLLLLLLAAGQEAESLFKQGVAAYAAENYQHAAELFERAIEGDPKVSRYHHWAGKAYGRRAERVNVLRAAGLAKKVRAAFERAVELDGKNLEALACLFEYYLEAPGIMGGGEEKARAAAARLAGLSAAEGHRAQASLLLKSKDHQPAAERELRQALELEPDKVSRLLDLASFLADRQRYAEAELLFDRAAKLSPEAPELLFARARLLVVSKRVVSKKDASQARRLLEQYLRSPRGPDDPPPSEVESLLKKLP